MKPGLATARNLASSAPWLSNPWTAPRGTQNLARCDVDRTVVDRPSRDALEPVDRLLKGIVAMRRRHLAVRRDEALEHADASVRVRGRDKKADAHSAYLNRFPRSRLHCVSRAWSLHQRLARRA